MACSHDPAVSSIARVLESDNLVHEGLRAAVALLRRNLGPSGILAASPSSRAEARNYTRVFGRDAAICALGMAVSGESDLLEGAARGLISLSKHQADNGQIPKFIDRHEPDFWYVGCIDATLWWLIAVDFLARHGMPSLRSQLALNIGRALHWSQCQEHPRLRLVQQNEASDWADIMPRSGFVLYSNALWYYVKRRYGLAGTEDTRFHFNHLFRPSTRDLPEYKRLRLLTHFVRHRGGDSDLYLSFVNFSFWGREGDTLGNLLAILFDLAGDARSHGVLHSLRRQGVDSPHPVRAVCTPIEENASLWRNYMGRHRQNFVYRYHNGGAWPFIGGFWALAHAKLGLERQASEALTRVTEANRMDGWAFNEWFDGITGTPQGMVGQSWNAAMLLLAHHGMKHRIF